MGFNGKQPAQLSQDLDAVVSRLAASGARPTFAIDLAVPGLRRSWACVGGQPVPSRDAPVFSAGCLLDIIVAIASNQLILEGALDLDAPLERYLPELAPDRASGEPVRIRDLLTRSSGIQDPRSIEEMKQYVPWEILAPRIRDAPRLCVPGAAFSYAGIDRVLLLVLLERVTGMPVRRIVLERVLGPCGVTVQPAQLGAPEADGTQRVRKFSTTNFVEVMRELAWMPDSPSRRGAFSGELRRRLQTERLALSRALRVLPWPRAATSLSLGLFRYSDGLIGFNGWEENQSCGARFDPVDQVSFVVALQGPPTLRDRLVDEIAERLGYPSIHSRPAPCTIGGFTDLTPIEANGDYIGWATGYGARITCVGGALTCEFHHLGRVFQSVRARVEEDRWIVVDRMEQASALEFYRDPSSGRACLSFGFLPYAKTAAGRPGGAADLQLKFAGEQA